MEFLCWAGGGEGGEFDWLWDVESGHGVHGRIAEYFVEVGCENDPVLKHDVVGYLADASFEAVVCGVFAVSLAVVAGSRDRDRVDEHGIGYCESLLTAASNDVTVLNRGPVDDTNIYHVH